MIGREVRLAARSGALAGPTPGLAPGFVQGNLVVLPAEFADDFANFCRLNPRPCPVIGMSEPGVPRVSELGADLDLQRRRSARCDQCGVIAPGSRRARVDGGASGVGSGRSASTFATKR